MVLLTCRSYSSSPGLGEYRTLIGPGQMALQRTLSLPKSYATDRVRPINPCLTLEYAALPRAPTTPWIDEMFRMFPLFCSIMYGSTPLMKFADPSNVIETQRSHSSSVTSSALCQRAM